MGNVVVTGAAHGIGAALARRFARGGNAVAVLDLDAEAAAAGAKRIEAEGGTALSLRCDVTSPDDCREAVARVNNTWGGIDVLEFNRSTERLVEYFCWGAGAEIGAHPDRARLDTWDAGIRG